MMTLEQLPPKGVKREQAILELGKEEANGELLLQLVNTERASAKQLLRRLWHSWSMPPAAPLWAKLVKGKWMGSHIMSNACSDCVSEQIAPVILKTLSQLLSEADTKPLEDKQVEQLNFCFYLMLGKASRRCWRCIVFWRKTQKGSLTETRPIFMTAITASRGGFQKGLGFPTRGRRKWRKFLP